MNDENKELKQQRKTLMEISLSKIHALSWGKPLDKENKKKKRMKKKTKKSYEIFPELEKFKFSILKNTENQKFN